MDAFMENAFFIGLDLSSQTQICITVLKRCILSAGLVNLKGSLFTLVFLIVPQPTLHQGKPRPKHPCWNI